MLLKAYSKLNSAYRNWRDPVAYARSIGVQVGERCRFIRTSPATFGSEPYLIAIGDHVTITAGVSFVTHDGGVWVFREHHPDIDIVAPIRVGNNVFVGQHAIIMPGVTIGSNVVIGAGSVVVHAIPSDCVAAGVPARPLKSLAQYWEKVDRQKLLTRGLDAATKRAVLSARFRAFGG